MGFLLGQIYFENLKREHAEGSNGAIKVLNGEEPDFYMYKDRMILL
jgi:hypothetical protein